MNRFTTTTDREERGAGARLRRRFALRTPPGLPGLLPALLVTVSGCLWGCLSGCVLQAPPASRRERVLEAAKGELWKDAETVVATVNGKPIRKGDIYLGIVEKLGPRTLLEQVVEEELFEQEAAKRDIRVEDGKVAEATDRYLEGMAHEYGGMEKLRERFASRGISVDQLRQDMEPAMRSELLRRAVVKSMRVINDETLRAYYEQTYKKKRYVTRQAVYSFIPGPGQSQAEVGSLKYKALRKAQRTVEKARQGHDFGEIARFESDDALTARAGGAVGALSEDAPLPAVFKEAIFALKPGEVSEPVESPQAMAFHVFQVTDIHPSESFVDCVDKMKKEMREREPTPEEIGAAVQSLWQSASIRYLPPETASGASDAGLSVANGTEEK